MGNSLSEAKAYWEAADYFMKAHFDSGQLNYEEHLSAALQAYSAAVKVLFILKIDSVGCFKHPCFERLNENVEC